MLAAERGSPLAAPSRARGHKGRVASSPPPDLTPPAPTDQDGCWSRLGGRHSRPQRLAATKAGCWFNPPPSVIHSRPQRHAATKAGWTPEVGQDLRPPQRLAEGTEGRGPHLVPFPKKKARGHEGPRPLILVRVHCQLRRLEGRGPLTISTKKTRSCAWKHSAPLSPQKKGVLDFWLVVKGSRMHFGGPRPSSSRIFCSKKKYMSGSKKNVLIYSCLVARDCVRSFAVVSHASPSGDSSVSERNGTASHSPSPSLR